MKLQQILFKNNGSRHRFKDILKDAIIPEMDGETWAKRMKKPGGAITWKIWDLDYRNRNNKTLKVSYLSHLISFYFY